jgi:DNA-binding NtrC family response regulator
MWRIKDYLPQSCKVILISGHTDIVEILNLKAMGVSAFLSKPLDLDQLCELVG